MAVLTGHRLWLRPALAAALVAGAVAAEAAPKAKSVPLPRPRPAIASSSAKAVPARTPAIKPLAAKPARPAIPLAFAQTTATSQADLEGVQRALEFIRKGKPENAVQVEQSVSDPVARKVIEWAALRSDDAGFGFERFAAFAAENPSWPSATTFRRKAEAALWQDRVNDTAVRGFFASAKPLTAKGKLAFARALIAQGDRAQATQYVRDAWRQDALSRDLETQVASEFGPLLTGGDHKARMEARFYAEDGEAAMRAANRLGGAQLAIAKARNAVIEKAGHAGKFLDAVPEEARRDPGYIFCRIQWLRRQEKFAEAAQLMLTAPRELSAIVDADEWWIERRLLARKLLDTGDPQTAYKIVRDATPPVKDNYRVELPFTAGWIALRALNEPALAMGHFAQIAQVSVHPTGLARAAYWQGRAAEALGRRDEARAHYERAALARTAYYGQLARARLGGGEIVLNPAPVSPPNLARLEVVRAAEILYALGERDLVVPMAADLADRADADSLAALANVAARAEDPRSLVLIGRAAIGRGLPFDTFAYPIEGLPRYTAVGPAVEPPVAYSIARQESGFNARVVSSANAMGLMQVTPAAGKYVAKKFSLPFDQKRLLSDPSYNVQIGAAELGDLIESYRGSYILSFAAYNAGRTRVRDWIERYGDPRDPKVDPVDWVESIPFSETRNYVQRVMENLQVYRVRFGTSSKLLIEADLRRGALIN